MILQLSIDSSISVSFCGIGLNLDLAYFPICSSWYCNLRMTLIKVFLASFIDSCAFIGDRLNHEAVGLVVGALFSFWRPTTT